MLTKGPENAVGTIEDLTGLHVDDWIVTGFDAVIKGVDEFGGVHVDVEQRLKDAASQTDLQPGYQQLSGWFTLAYSRDRQSRPDGDIGRSTGQAKVLLGMLQDLQDRATSPTRLVDFASILKRYTVTSISNEKLFRLALVALRLDPADIVNVTLPGTVGTAGAASVYRLSDQAFSIFADVRTDGVLKELETDTSGGD
jgi:anionic cell wall polymer biosynthesis LytR-Cps2A-Psr (LCP) family protein